jgi:hypothetical protein
LLAIVKSGIVPAASVRMFFINLIYIKNMIIFVIILN